LHEAKDEYQLEVEYALCATDAARNRLYYAQDNMGVVITKEDFRLLDWPAWTKGPATSAR
jgi:hypothetical protein